MRTTMMPSPTAHEFPTPPPALFEVAPAALDVLGITDTEDLFAVALPDETPEEAAARRTAAADILDDRLTDIATEALTHDVVQKWSV
ncbi:MULTISPECIES: hypothetical protein [Nocardiopsis]|uniref:Uncharacterized protein n=1 Tax=Nocardiopsis sinuspersici TaxID=501010 RepID=A0A1V3C752_9ACTN|nr:MULTISPECIES: hypothetical protein [Nocardiopsis]OOC56478.1 hypothetical protein NOSIN_23815 [Nocardiopsis sinuspersici]